MVRLEGFKFIYLPKFKIQKCVGNHSVCFIRGEIETENSFSYSEKVGSISELVEVSQDGEKILFCGIIRKIKVERLDHATFIEIVLYSLSQNIDKDKKKVLYQNTKLSFQNVIDALDCKGCEVKYADSIGKNKIESPICQFNETNFQFLRKIASIQKTWLIVKDTLSGKATINLGKPPQTKREIKNYKIDIINDNGQKSCFLTTHENLDIGESVVVEDKNLTCVKVFIFSRDGLIWKRYQVVEDIDDISRFVNIKPQDISGKCLVGKVANNKDPEKLGRLQLKFKGQPTVADGDFWFPYITPYADKLTGISFIPEIDSKVLLYFSDSYEKNAIILGNIRQFSTKDIENPDIKRIKFGDDQEIIFEKELIKIEGKGKKSSIELGEDHILLKNNKTIVKLDDNSISLVTSKASVKIESNVDIKGKKIKLN